MADKELLEKVKYFKYLGTTPKRRVGQGISRIFGIPQFRLLYLQRPANCTYPQQTNSR